MFAQYNIDYPNLAKIGDRIKGLKLRCFSKQNSSCNGKLRQPQVIYLGAAVDETP